MSHTIVLIGAGNVAHHLAKAISKTSHKIVQVYSRTLSAARDLSVFCNCLYTCHYEQIDANAEVYIFSLTDDANLRLIPQFIYHNKIMIHTSGSMNPDIFKSLSPHYGVLYPLQSLKKSIDIDMNNLPFLVEASNKQTLSLITGLVDQIGANWSEADTEQRTWAHISAVFACNFSNHMLAVAADIAMQNHIPWEMMKPLIENTFNRSLKNNPADMQTGPAFRNEKSVMEKHSNFLKTRFIGYEDLYKTISNSIFEMYYKNKQEDA